MYTPTARSETDKIHYSRLHDSWVQVRIPPGMNYSLRRSPVYAYEGHEDNILYVWINRNTDHRFDIIDMSSQQYHKCCLGQQVDYFDA